MADGVFNIAKGSFIEKVRDGAANCGILLLKANQAEDDLLDHATLAALLAAANTEADFTNYARKTWITGTITIDNVNNRADEDLADQTWTAAGGALNNTLSKAIMYYEESAADSGRIPMTHHDFIATTDGNNLNLLVNTSGIARAA